MTDDLEIPGAITLTPIGVVRNDVAEAVDSGWGAVELRIVLRPGLAGALDGLEAFSHVLVITWLHAAPPAPGVRRRPQGRADLPEIGILAQRARHRPNPIGVTAVALLGVEAAALRVRGLDAIDGTPVLDVKPYVPAFDRVEGARVPAWVGRLYEEADYF